MVEYKTTVADSTAMERTLTRISHQIIEKNESKEEICLIGIKTRGVPLAHRLSENIKKIYNADVKTGSLDITLYRDDLTLQSENPVLNGNDIDFNITGKTVILVDDVIYTGRTTRAALDALTELGRPARIQLCVLVDRGHRELPIRPDYVGKNVPTSKSEIIQVMLKETDGQDRIDICI